MIILEDKYPINIALDYYGIAPDSQVFYSADTLMPRETVIKLCHSLGVPVTDLPTRRLLIECLTKYVKVRLRQGVRLMFNPFISETMLTVVYIHPSHVIHLDYNSLMFACYGPSFRYGTFRNGEPFNFDDLAKYFSIDGYVHSQSCHDPWDIGVGLYEAINLKLTEFLIRGV